MPQSGVRAITPCLKPTPVSYIPGLDLACLSTKLCYLQPSKKGPDTSVVYPAWHHDGNCTSDPTDSGVPSQEKCLLMCMAGGILEAGVGVSRANTSSPLHQELGKSTTLEIDPPKILSKLCCFRATMKWRLM